MVLSFYKPAAADDREICKNASGDAAIAACTRAIESKKYAKKKFKRTLSLLYANRGVEYEIKKEFDKAVADHDESIKVDPKNWAAYNDRGNAYAGKHDCDHAIADYDEAVKSIRNMPRLLQSRSGETQQGQHGRRRRRHRASQGAAAGHC
jgi:tetratricopeptide (TPR) repeat protein